MTKQKFAVFDIDGTIIRWQLYHAIVDELVDAGYVSREQFNLSFSARKDWKQRLPEATFKKYEETLVDAFDTALTGIMPEHFMAAIKSAFEEHKDQIYTYTRDLIQQLKRQGYLLFAISASPEQVVELVANYYNFDEYGGSYYEIKQNRFTGNKEVLKRARKAKLLEQFIRTHNADTTGSIGIGDSESDIFLLEKVDRPIAFNPNKLLFSHACKHNWPIVIERKNMIYELEAKQGTYTLDTDQHVIS